MKTKLKQEKIIERFKKVHGNTYTYDKAVYLGYATKLVITCKIHGDFEQTPASHKSGAGCPMCGLIKQGKNYATPKLGESFKDKFPELCEEWSVNNSKKPENFKCGSHTKVLWTCKKCSYEWESQLKTRINHGCPNCSGRIANEENKLSIIRPDLIQEWDFIKNNDTPNDVTYSSNKSKWWICKKCSHSWKTSVNHRLKTNCPKCKSSKGEILIENFLIENNIEYKRQYKIPECKNKKALPFDFVIWINNKLKLIEFNGEQHYKICSGFYSCNQKLKYRQHNDSIKYNFCIQNNIDLLIIPYDKISDIETILLNWISQ